MTVVDQSSPNWPDHWVNEQGSFGSLTGWVNFLTHCILVRWGATSWFEVES